MELEYKLKRLEELKNKAEAAVARRRAMGLKGLESVFPSCPHASVGPLASYETLKVESACQSRPDITMKSQSTMTTTQTLTKEYHTTNIPSNITLNLEAARKASDYRATAAETRANASETRVAALEQTITKLNFDLTDLEYQRDDFRLALEYLRAEIDQKRPACTVSKIGLTFIETPIPKFGQTMADSVLSSSTRSRTSSCGSNSSASRLSNVGAAPSAFAPPQQHRPQYHAPTASFQPDPPSRPPAYASQAPTVPQFLPPMQHRQQQLPYYSANSCSIPPTQGGSIQAVVPFIKTEPIASNQRTRRGSECLDADLMRKQFSVTMMTSSTT